jgi:hypothetical protein
LGGTYSSDTSFDLDIHWPLQRTLTLTSRDLHHYKCCARQKEITMQDNIDGKFTAAVDTLAALAYQFGPFFFTVLFVLFITRTARSWYSGPNASTDPQEKQTYRNYFRASYLFGMVLCMISVAWWIRTQWEGHHAFAGRIVALNERQSLASVSDDQYFWSRLWAHQVTPPDALRDYWFVVVSDHPVHRGEIFKLNYWELSGSGGLNQAPPPPTATLDVPVTDPTVFPQKYYLSKKGQDIKVVPYN